MFGGWRDAESGKVLSASVDARAAERKAGG